ncbi:deoxyribodipyrimidine photo-lyase [Shigella flexneri]
MTTHLVWFRQDLRLHDIISRLLPPAAIRRHVLALYIATPRQWETHNMSPRQAELINAQLNGLTIALAENVFMDCFVMRSKSRQCLKTQTGGRGKSVNQLVL